jgi:hypothetical protein
MKQMLDYRSQVEQSGEKRCASCGATLQAVRSSNQRWSLESLLQAGMSFGMELCPACRQRNMEHCIGGFVSARL